MRSVQRDGIRITYTQVARRCWPAVLILALPAAALGAADYDAVVEDTMFRVRLDAPYQGSGCCEDGAMSSRPHKGSLPAPPIQVAPSKPGAYLRRADLAAAGGEAEGFQIVIMPKNEDLAQVALTASPLKADRGAGSIGAEQFAFNQVGYVQTRKPGYAVDRTGWFADPLLNPSRFDVKTGDVQPVWVTLRVPLGTPPGTYTGAITVQPQNAGAKTIPVSLKVWGFDIPARSNTLRLALTWDEGASQSIHGKADWDAKGLKRKYADMLLDHRIGPDNIYRGAPQSVEDAKYAVERGATAINLLNVGWPASYTDAQIEAILKRIESVWKQYQDAGIADKAYVYGFDETYHEKAIKQIYGAIGKKFPGLKRAVSVGWRGHEAVLDDVDIWSMSTGTYWHNFDKQEEMMDKLRAKGGEFWMYLSTSSGPSRPNVWIENALIEARSLGWILYMHDADGLLYYFINIAEHGTPKPIDDNAGPRTPWDPCSFQNFNGDGHLIYAGKSGPLSSVRLANLRDAIEDYEYLKTLERLLLKNGRAKTKKEARDYVKEHFVKYITVNLWIHTHEPALLRGMRAKVAEAIEELEKKGVAWRQPPLRRGGEPLVFEALRFDSKPGPVEAATLYARSAGAAKFESFELKPVNGACERAEIPGRLTASGPVQFYFETRYAGGKTVMTPEGGAAQPEVYAPDLAPPSAVGNIAAVAAASYRVALKWDAARDDSGVQGYEVHRGPERGFQPGRQTLAAEVPATALEFTDEAPPAGQTAWYAVLAADGAGRKGEAAYLKVDVPPDAPPANTLAVSAFPGMKSAMIRWDGQVEPDVAGFEIGRSDKAAGPFAPIKAFDGLDIRSYTDATAAPGQTYYYVVRLRDRGGNLSAPGQPVAVAPAAFVKRLNCGGPSFTPRDGMAWEADNTNRGDGTGFITISGAIAGAGDLQPVYGTERWSYGALRYVFDVPPGKYEVALHFAETNPAMQKAGGRMMDIAINGKTVADKLDVFAKAGANTAHVMRFPIDIPDKRLEIVLTGEPNGPMLKGIEIYGQSPPRPEGPHSGLDPAAAVA